MTQRPAGSCAISASSSRASLDGRSRRRRRAGTRPSAGNALARPTHRPDATLSQGEPADHALPGRPARGPARRLSASLGRPARGVGRLSGIGRFLRRDFPAPPPLQRHPDWIDKLLPPRFDAKPADLVSAALRLAGQTPSTTSAARLSAAGHDAKLSAELAELPTRLEDLRVASPTHLDILWGAF